MKMLATLDLNTMKRLMEYCKSLIYFQDFQRLSDWRKIENNLYNFYDVQLFIPC